MRWYLVTQAPRFACLLLAAVYVHTGSPWIALFPLGVAILGPGCPRTR